MAYPVEPLIRPSVLAGQANGRLPSTILETTPGLAGGVTVSLVTPAARAWRALTAAALAAGHTLKATSAADSYRKYEIQERIFRDRYTLTYLAGRPSKIWHGQRWYQRPGTAVAAVPGTSNHGWGLAVDTGEERDSDAAAESLDSATLNWLIENEGRFGFSHEVQSEPWHIRYNSGDNIPKAVLDFEAGPMSEEDDNMALIVKGADTHEWWITDGLHKDYVETAEVAGGLVFVGLARWDNGGPFTVGQAWIDSIPRIVKPESVAAAVIAALPPAQSGGLTAAQVADEIAKRIAS